MSNQWRDQVLQWFSGLDAWERVSDPVQNRSSLVFKNGDLGTTLELVFFEDQSGNYSHTFASESKLYALTIHNPKTPGLNSFYKEDVQNFEEGYFLDPPEFGEAGLGFTDINVKGVSTLLFQGLRGVETQYFKNQVLLASKVELDDYKDPFWKVFKKPGSVLHKFQSLFKVGFNESYFSDICSNTQSIDLETIFPGLSS